MSGKSHCRTCNKGGINMLCDRCEETFCDKHVIEHRRQLADQLNDINAELHLIKEELRQSSNQHSLLRRIDKWEKESIVQIQTVAASAREELRQMMEDAKERLSTPSSEIVDKLRSSRELGEYCENDLVQAMQQLNVLHTKTVSPLSAHLITDQKSAIHFVKVKGTDFMNRDLEKAKIYSITNRILTSDVQEQFSKVIGPATVSECGLLAKHNASNSMFAYVFGEQLYSQGRQTIRLKIEQYQTPYNIFFGCVSSHINPNRIHHNSISVAGWFGHNEVYRQGICYTDMAMHGYHSDKIEIYDVLSLTFNCEKKQIEFYPERMKKIHELPIDLDKIPFPWQLLIILTSPNDSVKILYKN